MVTDKLKQVVFEQLYKELSNVEIIPHDESIWFIDREQRYWYFELNEDYLWWRYDFFMSFFSVFSLSHDEFPPILSQWVSDVLNGNVLTSESKGGLHFDETKVDNVLDGKKFRPDLLNMYPTVDIDKVLDCKVVTPLGYTHIMSNEVDKALDSKVVTPANNISLYNTLVEKVLDSNVVRPVSDNSNLFLTMNEVLNQK